MDYDVILIHPPAIYDFRKKPLFSGGLATLESIQFPKVSIGILSIADYLDRHGYKVIINNLADRMVSDKDFDAEAHIKELSARIYAIGLHWHQHSQGAIEIAKLCKKLHPESLVIIGGLTATCFHKEIMQKYKFVDAVIRGEAEKPFLEFLIAFDKYEKITDTPNLTYLTDAGEVGITPLMKPSENLDEFEFTRLDLLEPKTSIFSQDMDPHWSLVVCRGCMYNCTVCGASAYSYKKYLGMEKPAFRSPGKIIDDIKRLSEQGIRQIGLYQDSRMGGKEYWQTLLSLLRSEKLDIERLTLDLLAPAKEEFLREVAITGIETILYICPDTGCEKVRRAQGRCYSNEELLDTIKICHRYHLPVQIFFSVGLTGETHKTIKETWALWDKICSLNKAAINRGALGKIGSCVLREGPIIGPIILDPGSLAFDFPERYEYRRCFKNLEEYIQALSQPSWHQWLNHETKQLNKGDFIELIHESIERFIYQRKKFGAYNNSQATFDLLPAKADRIVIGEVNRIMELSDKADRELRLKSLKSALDSFISHTPSGGDPYGYQEMMGKILFQPINFMDWRD